MKFFLSILFTCISILLFAQAIPIVEGIDSPSGLYKDADTIYFTSFLEGTINQKVLTETGTSYTSIAIGFTQPFGLHKRDSLLFVGHANGISSIDLSKYPVEITEVVTDNEGSITGIELVEPFIYYSIWGDVDEIWRVNLEKDNNTEMVASGFDNPSGLEYWNNKLFVADVLVNQVYTIDISNSLFEKEVFLEITFPNHLFVREDSLYVGQFSEGKVNKIDLTDVDKNVELLYEYDSPVTGVSSSGDKIYFSAYEDNIIYEYSEEVISSTQNVEAESFIVYPNPAIDFLQFDFKVSSSNFIIIDIDGRIVKEGELTENRIDIQNLPSNTYILYLIEEKKYARFIKM